MFIDGVRFELYLADTFWATLLWHRVSWVGTSGRTLGLKLWAQGADVLAMVLGAKRQVVLW